MLLSDPKTYAHIIGDDAIEKAFSLDSEVIETRTLTARVRYADGDIIIGPQNGDGTEIEVFITRHKGVVGDYSDRATMQDFCVSFPPQEGHKIWSNRHGLIYQPCCINFDL